MIWVYGGLMRVLFVCIVMTLAVLAVGAKPVKDHMAKLFKSDEYTFTKGTAPIYDHNAELEIGFGGGHGGSLDWMWFRPGKDVVDVLSIQFSDNLKPYMSKWPPDIPIVIAKRASMKPDAYVALLRDLAVVNTAKLKQVEGKENCIRTRFSSCDSWYYAHLTANRTTLVDLNWAGYEGSPEIEYAKPRAAVFLVNEAVRRLPFKEHLLTAEERAWASAKFVRDWRKFKDLEFFWWVRERYIDMIGVVGDVTVLPTLCDILGGNLKDTLYAGTDGRCVYYAINAITRLTKKDVRDKPVEEMDIEKTRQKVFDLLKDQK